jgi:FMN phosphatase YigB (HAD superfamily)
MQNTDFSWAADTDTMFWDMDLVLYKPHAKFIRTCWTSSYKTALKFLPHLTAREAILLSQKSWEEHHSAYDFLIKEHNFDQEKVLTVWHDNLDESFMTQADDSFVEKMFLAAKNHVIITHGSKPWTHRVLKQRNLQAPFPDKHIISFEDIFPNKKNVSTLPYTIAIDRTGCIPQHTPMIEDSQINLKKAQDTGLITIAVHQKPGTPQQIYTDYMLQTPEILLDHIIDAKKSRTLACDL